jgi:hypothetical protein
LLVAGILLLTSFAGHAGVQMVDRALAVDLYHLHRHGVFGEAAYIAHHGTWEGFVDGHCHRAMETSHDQPGPFDVQAAASLAGAVHCPAAVTTPVAAPALLRQDGPAERVAPPPLALPPLRQPPRG